MRKEKSRDAARSRRGKENHEFYELAKLLPLPAAITSQLDFLDKASIIRLTISFLKLRQFSVNGHPPWSTSFTTLASVNPYSDINNMANRSSSSASSSSLNQVIAPTISQTQQNQNITSLQLAHCQQSSSSVNDLSTQAPFPNTLSSNLHCLNPLITDPTMGIMSPKLYSKSAADLFELHQGTHMLHSLDGFAFAIGRDGRFLYISETVSMYLGLSQVEMTGSSVFDYTHHQDHQELANQLGIPFPPNRVGSHPPQSFSPMPPASVQSQFSVASSETTIEDHVNTSQSKRAQPSKSSSSKTSHASSSRHQNSKIGRKAAPQQGNKSSSNKKHHQEAKSNDNNSGIGENSGSLEQQQQRHNQTITKLPYHKDINYQPAQGTTADPLVRQFCIRMKSTLTKRGCQHFKSSGYRVVHVVSHLRTYQSNDHGHLMDPYDEVNESETELAFHSQKNNKSSKIHKQKTADTNTDDIRDDDGRNQNKSSASSSNIFHEDLKKSFIDNDKKIDPVTGVKPLKIIGMVAVAIALPPPSINELRLEADTFVFRLSLDLKITHAEARVSEVLHHPIDQLTGRSLYSLVHPGDLYQVQKCHQDLMQKGQMMSGYYRLLGKSGGYLWVQTCATLICNNTMGGVLGPPLASHSPLATNSTTTLESRTTCSSATLELSSFSSHINPKMSPGATSHFSSNFDQQEQDQCIIFVNYMISNLTHESDILDICQSANYSPMFTPMAPNSGNSMTSGQVILSSASPSSCSSPIIGGTYTNQHHQRTFLNSPSYTTSGAIIGNNPTKQTSSRTLNSMSEQTVDTHQHLGTPNTRRLTGHKSHHSKKDRTSRTSQQQQQQQQDTIATLEVAKGSKSSHHSTFVQDDVSYSSNNLLSSRLTNLETLYSGHSQMGSNNHVATTNSSVFTTPPAYGSPAQSGVSYSNRNNNNNNNNSANSLSSNSSSSTTNNSNSTSSNVCDNNNHLISSAIHLYNNGNALDSSINSNNDDNVQQQRHDHNGDGDGTSSSSSGAYKRRKHSNVSPLRPWKESVSTSTPNCHSLTQLTMSHSHHNTSSNLTENQIPYLTPTHGASFMDGGSTSGLSDHHHLSGYASAAPSTVSSASSMFNPYGSSAASHKSATIYHSSGTTSPTSSVLLRHMGVLPRTEGTFCELKTADVGSYLSGHNQATAVQHHTSHYQSGPATNHQVVGSTSASTHAYIGGHSSASSGSSGAAAGGSNHQHNNYYHPLVDPYHHHHHLYKNGSLHHHNHHHQTAAVAAAAAAAALAVNSQHQSTVTTGMNSSTNLNSLNHHTSTIHHPYGHSYN